MYARNLHYIFNLTIDLYECNIYKLNIYKLYIGHHSNYFICIYIYKLYIGHHSNYFVCNYRQRATSISNSSGNHLQQNHKEIEVQVSKPEVI